MTDPSPITASQPLSSRRGTLWRRLLQIVVLVAVVCFLGRSIVGQWGAIRAHPWHLNAYWLIGSAAMIWCDFVILIALWRYLLAGIAGRALPWRSAYRVWFLSNMGKYLPGKIWTVMGMVYLLQGRGFAAPAVLAAAILNQAFSILSGAILVVIVLGSRALNGLPVLPIALGLAVTLVILYPPWFAWLINRGLRRFGYAPISIPLSFGRGLLLFLAYALTWLVYGVAFWVMLQGMSVNPGPILEVSAVFAGAYLIGFLAVFAPGGLGVREGALAVLLKPYLGTGLASLAAVASRLWMSIVEMLGLVPLLWWREREVAPAPPAPPTGASEVSP